MVGPLPRLFTVSEYVAVPPCWNVLDVAFTIVRSGGGGLTVVGSLAVLFAVLISPPPATLAEFVTKVAASAATANVAVMSG